MTAPLTMPAEAALRYTMDRLDRARKHKLLRKADVRALPALYSQENEEDPVVHVKLFCPYSQATWLLTEYDGDRIAFGFATLDGVTGELGYCDILELGTLSRMAGQLPMIERDCWFQPCKLSEAKKQIGIKE